jgi:dihydroorotase
VDLEKKYKIDSADFQSKGVNTPFDGMEVYGKVMYTIKNGKMVFSA